MNLARSGVSIEGNGIRPENVVWILGSIRTGSTWLGSMMGELEGNKWWNEPLVGEVFGFAYYIRAWEWQREREQFILANRYRKVWIKSIRSFVLDGANARYPELGESGYLVIQEPYGSIGAPLLMEALPESRMIFLVRDPRDVVASQLDAHRRGSWLDLWSEEEGWSANHLADEDPDAFVETFVRSQMQSMGRVWEAYEAHEGRKVLVRYEDLRSDPLKTLSDVFIRLGIPVDEAEFTRVVEKYIWENIPEERKGEGKFHRKATPGGWKEDLSPKQVKMVEEISAPILDGFYPGWRDGTTTTTHMPTRKRGTVHEVARRVKTLLGASARLVTQADSSKQVRERLADKGRETVRLQLARESPAKGGLSSEQVHAAVAKVEHWYHRIEVAPGIVTPGTHDSEAALAEMNVPENLSGKRLLDVGARDGYFSFVAEARGAEVVAIDAVPPHLNGFSTASSLLGSSVEYRTMNVYNLNSENVGTFDLIFFLGVLYHLRDPMLALDRLWEVARPGATIWVESHTIDSGLVAPATGKFRELASVAPDLVEVPMVQFYPRDLLLGNPTNWWGPNLAALKAMLEEAGFEVVRSKLIGRRGLVVGRKTEDSETTFHRNFDRADARRMRKEWLRTATLEMEEKALPGKGN